MLVLLFVRSLEESQNNNYCNCDKLFVEIVVSQYKYIQKPNKTFFGCLKPSETHELFSLQLFKDLPFQVRKSTQ